MDVARGLGIAAALVAIGVTGVLAQPQPDARQVTAQAVTEASQAAKAAEQRAAELDRAAAGARDDEARARAEQAAAAQRIQAAEAEQVAAEARMALLDRLLSAQRAAFAERQRPALELVAALQAMARRPAVLALAQPGSAQDLVHVRATLASLLPAMEARSAGVRADLERSRALRVAAGHALAGLRANRAALESRRLAALQLESEHRLRAMTLGRDALVESDRALALGEKARDLAAAQDRSQSAAQVRSDLLVLNGPLPRPGASAERTNGPAPYRLPVAGHLVTGFGEISSAGVRARGPSFAVTPGTKVIAPAAGTIAYAAPFAGYGQIVVLDHGKGWTTLISGLSALVVRPGAKVGQGATLGAAGPRMTVELRRRGQPLDLTQLLD
ncbi:murein hydrolase activator EnvC family protein [Sphingomonas sp. TDK1]|uniref:murein hydrolase activator EnvC family protein n=1 Tax=Sphingomonas sp. TDK1 TaxID=453247 RepID=UPI0007D948C7|nr:peptidoglycan DD-metalloendopeptidase family protein [Sphingomonas sp. TDK1]OAN66342.1 metalloendopeptidase [Sphingomonas sp. TDK1]